MEYFQYWGKAGKKASSESIAQEKEQQFHLLPYHCLDVAAVGWCLLTPDGALCQKLSLQLSVQPQWLQAFFSFALMLHDLGKFCRGFQNLAPNLSANLVRAEPQRKYEIRGHLDIGWTPLLCSLRPQR